MNDVTGILDQGAAEGTGSVDLVWQGDVERSLQVHAKDWAARTGALPDEQAWRLLDWAELSCSVLVTTGRTGLASTIAFALAVADPTGRNGREVQLVGNLLHRACDLSGQDFGAAVRTGCEQAGAAPRVLETLLPLPASSHLFDEVRDADGFWFRRKPAGFDPVALEAELRAMGGR